MKIDIKKLFNKKKDMSEVSVPLGHELHGVKIRKLPNGAYIKALNAVQNLPEILLKGCFPGQNIDDILKFFGDIDTDGLVMLAGKLLSVVPEQFLKLISELLDISCEKLIDELSPNETREILKAFWEVNDMSPFFESLKKMIQSKGIMNLMSEQSEKNSLIQNTGFKTGSI